MLARTKRKLLLADQHFLEVITMAMGKKHKANIALAISILGAGATFSVANAGFLGGMLHNG